MRMKERIENGELFLDDCQGLPKERMIAKHRMAEFNQTMPDEVELRYALSKEIFGTQRKVLIEPPFYFSYGRNIQFGENCYVNFNCNFLDDGKIVLGNNVIFGPAVTIITVEHPINPNYRKFMYTNHVVIEDNCSIGTNVTICPGVTIGENTVIGAGSVVTKTIPDNCIAYGNPCEVIRKINQNDMNFYNKDKTFDLQTIEEILRVNGE